jgi:hypothetical protein
MTAAVQRTADVAKNGGHDPHRPEVLHQQFTEQLQKQTRHHERQVQQSNEAQSAHIKRDGKGQADKRRKPGQRSDFRRDKKNDSSFKQSGLGSLLDISI